MSRSVKDKLQLFQVVCAVNSSRRRSLSRRRQEEAGGDRRRQEEAGGDRRRLLRLLVSDVTEPAAEEDVRLQECFPESWHVVNMTSCHTHTHT